MYQKRLDLMLCGRTLFGSTPPKGQELEEHYFGAIRPSVSAFMKELDEELWKLGIPAKTKHNEVAPCQHELAPIYDTTNVAIDHNLLTMEMMKKIADKHGLVCLQHEKPFEGVNGSGKHNNWSIVHQRQREPAGPRRHPDGKRCSSCCSCPRSSRPWTIMQDLLRTSVATAGQRSPSGRQRGTPGHHFHLRRRGAGGRYRCHRAPIRPYAGHRQDEDGPGR